MAITMREVSDTPDVPHANRPGIICTIVRIMHFYAKVTAAEIERAVGLSPRHLDYYLHAARIAGLLSGGGRCDIVLTTLGHQLAMTPPGSGDEREAFRRALASTPDLTRWVLGAMPDAELILEFCAAGLSDSSAKRRVSTVRSWRRFLNPSVSRPARKSSRRLGPRSPAAVMTTAEVPESDTTE